MGGKSTLLRMSCVAILMAQLGCYVPAESCSLTPMDRIFTRIGASDNILAGHSTFMVELQETSRILSSATRHSLVILDELGRGTSTFDGFAIAYAVLHHLASNALGLCLFSTHYHSLTSEFADNAVVALKHMDSLIDRNNRTVAFLYTLVDGPSDKSHGMNVAAMAGVPGGVIERAEEAAERFQRAQQSRMEKRGGSRYG